MAKRWRIKAVTGWCLWLICQGANAGYWIQVATFSKMHHARKTVQALVASGFSVELRKVASSKHHQLLQLVVGPYVNEEGAEAGLKKLQAIGQAPDGFIMKTDRPLLADDAPFEEQAYRGSPSAPPIPPESASSAVPAPPEDSKAGSEEQGSGSVTAAIRKDPDPPAPLPVARDDNDLSALDLGQQRSAPRLDGFFQSELAYAYSSPAHLSKFRNTLMLGSEGSIADNITWKASGWVAYDAVFDLNSYYPTPVRDDQQLETQVRETYADISAGDWDFRLGRQNIIWGEMVGLFFADVVSAKDMREFLLPDFDMLRIPQWALRSEYFKGNFHGEAIWIPYPTYDEIGVPGAEFYPYPSPPPPGYGEVIAGEHRPVGSLADGNYGVRLSELINDWDVSAFYYSSMDASATFFREIVTTPIPTVVYTPDHRRIEQAGSTLSKAYEDTVLRLEAVYTHDRWFAVNDISNADGVTQADTLDYAAGLDYNAIRNSRLNFQFFQRWFPSHDSTLVYQRFESGASFYASTKLRGGTLEPQFLVITDLDRGDWMARPRLVWTLNGRWQWTSGLDMFGGSRRGLFGQYDGKNRIYTQLRYDF